MAYQCILDNRECDGCERCHHEKSGNCCSVCGASLADGEYYYEIDEFSICAECITLSRRIA